MSLTASQKAPIVKKFARSANDTGSAEVQIALLSERITVLTEHMKANKQDVHSRLGLLKMVSKRRKLLNYLKKSDRSRYFAIVKALGLRR